MVLQLVLVLFNLRLILLQQMVHVQLIKQMEQQQHFFKSHVPIGSIPMEYKIIHFMVCQFNE